MGDNNFQCWNELNDAALGSTFESNTREILKQCSMLSKLRIDICTTYATLGEHACGAGGGFGRQAKILATFANQYSPSAFVGHPCVAGMRRNLLYVAVALAAGWWRVRRQTSDESRERWLLHAGARSTCWWRC